MARALRAWAINRWKKTRLIRGIYFKWFVISSCHFHNVHTEYFGPRKSLQGEFPKSEKENFDEDIATPCLLGVPGGVLPYKSLMGMCRWMGSHFHNWSDYYGVAFLIELLEWGRKFSNFGGK